MAAQKSDPNKTDQAPEKEAFDPKWLKSLTFATTRKEKVKGDDGEVREKRVPFTRPLEEDDLLDWKVYGQEVVLVTADGRKHRVKK